MISGDYHKYVLPPKIGLLPISVLKLSVRSTNALHNAEISTLQELKWVDLNKLQHIGATSIDEITSTLEHFLLDVASFSEQELNDLIDGRPYLIKVNCDDKEINLVKLIIPIAQALVSVSGDERGYIILEKRFGLGSGEEYTLQEIGDFFDLTRERVRQIEEKILSKLQHAITTPDISGKWRMPETVINKVKEYSDFVAKTDVPFTEAEIIQLTEQYFNFEMKQEDIISLKLLLVLLGYSPISKTISGWGRPLRPAWVNSNYKIARLYKSIPRIFRIIQTSVVPISLFDLTITVNKKRKNKISTQDIEHSIKILSEIEVLPEKQYQLNFESLSSLADQAFRVLYENNNPMHLRDLQRGINYRMVKAGFSTDARIRSLGNQLASDTRFSAIGRSGSWSLTKWENIRRETIVELMQEFFHIKQSSATADEIFEFVVSKRKNVAKNSITLYLTTNDLFVRVSKAEYQGLRI